MVAAWAAFAELIASAALTVVPTEQEPFEQAASAAWLAWLAWLAFAARTAFAALVEHSEPPEHSEQTADS